VSIVTGVSYIDPRITRNTLEMKWRSKKDVATETYVLRLTPEVKKKLQELLRREYARGLRATDVVKKMIELYERERSLEGRLL